LITELTRRYPWLPSPLAKRYVRTYGTLSYTQLSNAISVDDLGLNFGADMYAAEVNYLIKHEWALTVEDIIWRRTKLGLSLSEAEVNCLAEYVDKRA
jgi:glycerol-3-phosphate dehydrogenase